MSTVTNVCFHGVGTLDREREPGEASYWVGRDVFLQILDALVGRPDVRISFDDGSEVTLSARPTRPAAETLPPRES